MSVRKSRQSRAFENAETVPVTPARNPRHSIVYAHSPLSTPSLSASVPFDWEAAKGNRPAPYQTPSGSRVRRMRASMGVGTDTPPSASSLNFPNARKPRQSRVIVRTSWRQWLVGLPAQWWLKLTMLQHDLPLPPPKTTGRIIGITLHLIHACAKWAEIRDMHKAEDGWGELNVQSIFLDDEEEQGPLWTRWPFLITAALFFISLTRTLVLFQASKSYDLQLRGDNTRLLSSPNVSLIPSPLVKEEDPDNDSTQSIWSYLSYFLSIIWHGFTRLVRFLVYHPKKNLPVEQANVPHIQRIQVWDPSDQDLVMFQIYSPLHAALWYLVQPGNWPIVLFVMVVTTAQLGALTTAYRQLVKDREIVASEVMYEYNTRFVNPRLNPSKRDACVMTHESEMVDYRSGYSSRY